MGVIQNSINTFLGIAAVGARTSPTLQARTQSHELSDAADAASKGAAEQGKAYDELYKQLSKDAETNKEINDHLTSEYNRTVKEQEEVRKMYADNTFDLFLSYIHVISNILYHISPIFLYLLP